MIRRYWDHPLHVGKTDRYSLTISENWLAGQIITSATAKFHSGGDLAVITSTDIIGPVISIEVNGVELGYPVIEIEYATIDRQDCQKCVLSVEEC